MEKEVVTIDVENNNQDFAYCINNTEGKIKIGYQLFSILYLNTSFLNEEYKNNLYYEMNSFLLNYKKEGWKIENGVFSNNTKCIKIHLPVKNHIFNNTTYSFKDFICEICKVYDTFIENNMLFDIWKKDDNREDLYLLDYYFKKNIFYNAVKGYKTLNSFIMRENDLIDVPIMVNYVFFKKNNRNSRIISDLENIQKIKYFALHKKTLEGNENNNSEDSLYFFLNLKNMTDINFTVKKSREFNNVRYKTDVVVFRLNYVKPPFDNVDKSTLFSKYNNNYLKFLKEKDSFTIMSFIDNETQRYDDIFSIVDRMNELPEFIKNVLLSDKKRKLMDGIDKIIKGE